MLMTASGDGTNFFPVAYGAFVDDAKLKTVTIVPANGQYLRIEASSEAGNRGAWTSAAEINIMTADGGPPGPVGKGQWGLTIDFPLVPVSLANEPASGNILAWSSYDPSTFGGSAGTQTITASYAPGAQTVTPALITNTQHDMFCEGLSLDFDGKAVASGGNTASAVSVFDSGANTWNTGPVYSPLQGYRLKTDVVAGAADSTWISSSTDSIHWRNLHDWCIMVRRSRWKEW